MKLGNFSVSLNVKDLKASRTFYEKLGFTKLGGEESQNWLIMKNESAIIGLFQGMFDHNILTFNPLDVRSAQKALKGQGVAFDLEAEETGEGPAHAVLKDPDGNAILLDQH
jgi:catechol 2,3-dioxygenase-like lactoylglutathione lyase family enzyme